MSGGKDDDGGGDTTVRYAPYLESAHSSILNHAGADSPTSSFIDIFNVTLGASPYADYESIDLSDAFFSDGYSIGDFPSLWDMFGKFMAGLDLHDLWSQTYDDVLDGGEIANAVAAQSAVLLDELDSAVFPRFDAGMRDINAVQSSAFIIGRANILEDGYLKAINKFQAQIRLHVLDVSVQIWNKHVDWNEAVIRVYGELFKLYYSLRMDAERDALEYQAKDAMWDINLFENARAMLGALTGAAATADKNEPSTMQKAVGGAMSGAAAGYMASSGNPVGAVIGGALGLAASLF